jgi:hypothetical protein
MKDIKTNIPLLASNNHYISEQKYVKYLDFLPNKHFRGKQKPFDLLNKSNSILKLKEKNERLTTLVGKVTVEKKWLAKKLKSLNSKAWADHHLMTKEVK